MDEEPQVVFPEQWDQRAKDEMRYRGVAGPGLEVRLPDGRRYPVSFMDPVRLAQDVEAHGELGRPALAEPGLIVVPEVTVEAMNAAIRYAWREGFFEYLRALGDAEEQAGRR